MPRGNRDKWKSELKKATQNFNRKAARLRKQGFVIENIKVKNVANKKEADREIKWLKKFTAKGGEGKQVYLKSGEYISEWEYKYAKESTRIANIKNANIRKKISPEKGNMRAVETENLRPKKISVVKDKQDFLKYVESLEHIILKNYDDEAKRKFKENYLKAMEGFSHLPDGKKIYDLVKSLHPDKLVYLATNNPKLSIKYRYDENQELDDILESMLEEFENEL